MCHVPYHSAAASTSSNKQDRTAAERPHNYKTSSSMDDFMLLLYAADNNIERFKHLVEHGAMIDSCGTWYCRQHGSKRMAVFERTPAMMAAMYGSIDVLNYILGQGSNINMVCGTDKNTALHSAAWSGLSNASQIVDLLLKHGADPNAMNAQGRRPLDAMCNSIKSSGSHGRNANESMRKAAWDEMSEFLSEDPWGTDATALMQVRMLSETSGGGYGDEAGAGSEIKGSAYSSDEFRMYSLKVRPCSRAYSHDWTECPFAHPGENARRRDPRKYNYSCVPCSDFRKASSCKYGDACEYAHGVFETWLHPTQYRTRMCKEAGSNCNRRICFFAHSQEQLRRPSAEQTSSEIIMSPRTQIFSMDADPLSSSPLSHGFSSSPIAMLVHDHDHYKESPTKSFHGTSAEASAVPGLNLLRGGSSPSSSKKSLSSSSSSSSNWNMSWDLASADNIYGRLEAILDGADSQVRQQQQTGRGAINADAIAKAGAGGYRHDREDFCNSSMSPKSPLQMYYLRSNSSPLIMNGDGAFKRRGDSNGESPYPLRTTGLRENQEEEEEEELHPNDTNAERPWTTEDQMLAQMQLQEEDVRRRRSPSPYAWQADPTKQNPLPWPSPSPSPLPYSWQADRTKQNPLPSSSPSPSPSPYNWQADPTKQNPLPSPLPYNWQADPTKQNPSPSPYGWPYPTEQNLSPSPSPSPPPPHHHHHPYHTLLPHQKRSQSSDHLHTPFSFSSHSHHRWSSPTRNPEWGAIGDDLTKFRKSMSLKENYPFPVSHQ